MAKKNEEKPKEVEAPAPMDRYDMGLINDYGGGRVEWWQDYLRAEVDRANDSCDEQFEQLRDEAIRLKSERDDLLAACNGLKHVRECGQFCGDCSDAFDKVDAAVKKAER